MGLLIFDDVTFYYEEKKKILSDINLSIQKGEFHCLVGRSGCGKTTLLKLAAGLILSQSGQVLIDGNRVTAPAEDTSFVFQSPTLLNWKTVLQNILMPISLQHKITHLEIEKAYYLLEMMKMKEYAEYYPNQLSGGQQSRVSIARALITSPSILFMDEPFAALDAMTREELQDDLLKICQQEETTILFITHDIQEAVYLADQITVMEAGQLIHSIPNSLERSEDALLRYSQAFNERCLEVRRELERTKQ